MRSPVGARGKTTEESFERYLWDSSFSRCKPTCMVSRFGPWEKRKRNRSYFQCFAAFLFYIKILPCNKYCFLF